eukprot:2776938-Ditylum_brightwellii.AAC.1
MDTGENSAWVQFIAVSAPGKVAALDECALRKGSDESVETGSSPHVEEMSVEKPMRADDAKVNKNIWNNRLKTILLYEEDKPWIKAFDIMR